MRKLLTSNYALILANVALLSVIPTTVVDKISEKGGV